MLVTEISADHPTPCRTLEREADHESTTPQATLLSGTGEVIMSAEELMDLVNRSLESDSENLEWFMKELRLWR